MIKGPPGSHSQAAVFLQLHVTVAPGALPLSRMWKLV